MNEITEDELIESFEQDISTYPFKTRLIFEKPCKAGRIDLSLPEYDVVIEAKSEGDIKGAIGQAICYSEVTNSYGYILIPVDEVKDYVVSACKRSNIGVITTTKGSLNFAIVNDIGGFESFHPKHYENIHRVKFESTEPRSIHTVGGVD